MEATIMVGGELIGAGSQGVESRGERRQIKKGDGKKKKN